MATSVFIDPVDTDSWGEQQRAECRAFEPVLKDFLAAQRQNVGACERFYDAQHEATKGGFVPVWEYLQKVRIPVLNSLGYHFEGADADRMYGSLYYVLGSATCLYFHFPAAGPNSPELLRNIDADAGKLAAYLVSQNIRQAELQSLLELARRL